jgi:general secretion pathway protein J
MEILVALVLLGFVLTLLTGGMRLGLRAKRAEAQLEAAAGELEAASRALRHLFARAEPGDPASPNAVFVGTEHTVSFVSKLRDGRDMPRETEVSLAVDGGRRLELRWRPHFRRWIAPPPPPSAKIVLEHVDRLDLSYWDLAAGRWATAWNGVEPPRLVRLRIVFSPGDRRHWPDIIVAPVRQAIRP